MLKNEPLVQNIPKNGIVFLRDGNVGEPEVLLSPPCFIYQHVAEMVRISMQYAVIKPLMGGAMGYFGIPMAHSGATKYHSGGLVGDEIPIIAKRGESVFTKGQMAVLGSELGAKTPVLVNVQVLNKAEGTKATAQSSQDAQGNVSLNIIVEQIESSIGRNIGRGEGLAPLLEQRYALNPALGSYR